MRTTCVHAPHNVCPRSTLTHLKYCKADWPNWQALESFFFIFVQNPSIGQPLSHQSQHHIPSMELQYSNSCQQFSAYIYSTHALTSNPFWVGWQAPQLICIPTYMHITLAHSCTKPNRVSVVDGTSLWRSLPSGPEWHTHWVCYPVCQCSIPEISTRHHAKQCTKQDMWNQTRYHLQLRATLSLFTLALYQSSFKLVWSSCVNAPNTLQLGF